MWKKGQSKLVVSILVIAVIILAVVVFWQFSIPSIQQVPNSVTGNVINEGVDSGLNNQQEENNNQEEETIPQLKTTTIDDAGISSDDEYLEKYINVYNFDCYDNGFDITCKGDIEFKTDKLESVENTFSMSVWDNDNGCFLYSDYKRIKSFAPRDTFEIRAELKQYANVDVDIYYHQAFAKTYPNDMC